MAYGDFEDLARRTASDKVLGDKTFNTAKNPKYDGYQRIQFLCFLNFLIKNPQIVVLIVKKFKRRRVYSSFKDNIKGVDLADMQLIIGINTIKELDFYYVLLIFLSNMHGMFL